MKFIQSVCLSVFSICLSIYVYLLIIYRNSFYVSILLSSSSSTCAAALIRENNLVVTFSTHCGYSREEVSWYNDGIMTIQQQQQQQQYSSNHLIKNRVIIYIH